MQPKNKAQNKYILANISQLKNLYESRSLTFESIKDISDNIFEIVCGKPTENRIDLISKKTTTIIRKEKLILNSFQEESAYLDKIEEAVVDLLSNTVSKQKINEKETLKDLKENIQKKNNELNKLKISNTSLNNELTKIKEQINNKDDLKDIIIKSSNDNKTLSLVKNEKFSLISKIKKEKKTSVEKNNMSNARGKSSEKNRIKRNTQLYKISKKVADLKIIGKSQNKNKSNTENKNNNNIKPIKNGSLSPENKNKELRKSPQNKRENSV